jgi:hypothetical protein
MTPYFQIGVIILMNGNSIPLVYGQDISTLSMKIALSMTSCFGFIFVLFIFGCDDDSANNTQSCGANEHLEDMACVCNDGYHFENNECISESNNCTEPCGDNEHCEDGACVCDDGYHRDGDNCVLDNTNPCANVDCGEQGSCVNIEGAAACECDYGYVSSDQFCIHLRDAFDQAVANQDSDLVW